MTPGRNAALLLAATAVTAVIRPSFGQSAGDGFLFQAPVGSWGVHGGFDRATAGGDVFSFVTNQLTLSRADFSSATFGGNVAIHLSATNDIVFDFTYASVARRSEFRDWVDQNNQPIEQTTSLHRLPITASVKHYPRVVNGQGYVQGGNPRPAQATPRPTEPRWPTSSGASTGSGAGSSSGSSSGSGEQRTAKPRPPK